MSVQKTNILLDGILEEIVILRNASCQDRCESPPDAIVPVCSIGCANRGTDANERRRCLGYLEWGMAKALGFWVLISELCTTLQEWHAVINVVTASRSRGLPHCNQRQIS